MRSGAREHAEHLLLNGAPAPERSSERRRILFFHCHPNASGTASAIYAGRLRRLLEQVDRFFGEAELPAAPHWRRLFRVRLRCHDGRHPPVWRQVLSLVLLSCSVTATSVWPRRAEGDDDE